MKPFFLLLLVPFCCNAQAIRETGLVLGKPIRILLSKDLTTTVMFPAPISGVFGLGLVSGQGNTVGSVQCEHPDGSGLLVLHALTDTAHVIATVLLNGNLYVLDFLVSNIPDVAVTLRNGNVQGDAPRATQVTSQEVVDARPKYDPEILDSLLRLARDNVVLRPIYPDLYQGYQNRDTWFTSDSGSVKTTVTAVHRFPAQDAVVVQGTVENETDQPLKFDGRAVTVQAGNRVYPIKLVDCIHTIPAHQRTLIDCVIQGENDGGRANLSVDNKYRIYLPGNIGVWALKNGAPPDKSFKVPTPLTKAVNQ